MDPISSEGSTPLLDSWRNEIGDDAIAEAVATARRQIAKGIIPALTDIADLRNPQSRPA